MSNVFTSLLSGAVFLTLFICQVRRTPDPRGFRSVMRKPHKSVVGYMNMNTHERFKYDVAISFLQEDEALARELNDLLGDRLTTFVYFDRQKELAGTDGEQTLNRVFGIESRNVVVLYRDHWGSTPWTRIEETAIRNRGYEEGYDFLTMIPLNSPPSPPKWFPKTRIWVDFDRWGPDGAASVIEARVQETSGSPKQESPVEQASRLSRRKRDEEQRLTLLNSEGGVNLANQEMDALFGYIEGLASEITNADGDIKLGYKRINPETLDLYSWGYQVHVSWVYHYTNSLLDSRLVVNLRKRERSAAFRNEDRIGLAQEQFNFDVRLPDRFGWTRKSDQRFFTSAQLASHCLKQLLDRLQKDQPWKHE
jgi:hypothetical protein